MGRNRGACELPGFETARPEEQRAELQKTFKRVFQSADGKIVFNALLKDLFYFDAATSDAEKALCEYAKFFIRERLGIKKTLSITDAILSNLEQPYQTLQEKH